MVVITGASSGLGEAAARRLAKENSVTEVDVAQGVRALYDRVAIPADSFARTVVFAMSQPDEVDINEILFRPTAQEY